MTSHLTDTDSVDLTDNAGFLEARVRTNSSIATTTDGLRVAISAQSGNALAHGSDGGLYVTQSPVKSTVSQAIDTYPIAATEINSTVFNSGFRINSSDETLFYAHSAATTSEPLAAVFRPPHPLTFTNPSAGTMALVVDLGLTGSLNVQVQSGQFITLKFQLSVNNGAWFTYAETGMDNSGANVIGTPSANMAFTPPRTVTSVLLAGGANVNYRIRTLVCWRSALPASGSNSNIVSYYGYQEIVAFGVAA